MLVTKIIEAAHNEKGEEWDRDQVLKTAKIRPLRYFHHVTGYGESRSNEPTREDYFSNPTKALIKLEDDIFPWPTSTTAFSRRFLRRIEDRSESDKLIHHSLFQKSIFRNEDVASEVFLCL